MTMIASFTQGSSVVPSEEGAPNSEVEATIIAATPTSAAAASESDLAQSDNFYLLYELNRSLHQPWYVRTPGHAGDNQ